MAFEQGSGFRICGSVVRKWVASTNTVARLVLDVFVDGKSKKLDMIAFKDPVIDVAGLEAGQIVEVTGRIDTEKLTDKKREAVKVDGYEKWVPMLVIRSVKVAPSSKKSTPKDEHGEDTVDF